MTTYSISLDDVDLAFLPLRTHKYNDFLKKEHFQFQVMKKDNVEEPVPTVYYTCHVCAIEVPASFASEHVASIKHRANARIASVAMLRSRKLISSFPPLYSETIHPPSGRFCTNCALVADVDHDTTKEHRVAAMHDNLLWDLMKAYIGEVVDDEESENDHKDNVKAEDPGKNWVGDYKKNDTGFENDGNNATVVSVASQDTSTALPESTDNNVRADDKNKSKIVDHTRNIFINDDSFNKCGNAAADAAPAQSTNKKRRKQKTKSKPWKSGTVVSNCDIISNKNLERDTNNEELSKMEIRINTDRLTHQTDLYKASNNHILDTSRQQDEIKNVTCPNGQTKINKTEPKIHNSKDDNKNIETPSIDYSISRTYYGDRQFVSMVQDRGVKDQKTNRTYFNEPRKMAVHENKTVDHTFRYNYTEYEILLALICNKRDTEFKETEKNVQIKVHNNVLVVQKNRFHGYERIYGNNNSIRCLICDLILEDKYAELHKQEMYHMTIVTNIEDNNDYVRKINNTYSHCIVCNMKLHNTVVAMHKQNFLYHLRCKNKIYTIQTASCSYTHVSDNLET